MEWNRDWPAPLQHAVGRWGTPVGVEEARHRWAELVRRAEAGTPTLITVERCSWAWAALVPLAELYEPQWQLTSHAVTEARPKLAELIRAAHAGVPQLLRRHHTMVAAVMTADRVVHVPPGERLDVDALLRDGASITLTYKSGADADVIEDGDGASPSEPAAIQAVAIDASGAHLAAGAGITTVEALARLRRARIEHPREYDTESPF